MNRSRWWALALLISATPRCSCEDGESLVRAAVEMELTFLEEEGCAPEPVRLRIPDDFKEGRAPAADFGSRDFRRFEVRSRGTTSLQVDAVELSQADDEFTLEITDGAGNPVSFPVALPPVSSESAPPGLIIVARYSATDTEPDGVELVVRSDDPDREEVRFALTAGRGRIEVCTETGCGDLAAVTFGAVPQGASASKTVSVRNIGEGDLDLRAIRLVSASTEFCAPAATEIPDFTPNCDLEAQCLVLRANETLDVDIRYAPTDGNVDTGELVIVSGDTQASSVTVPINAQGAEPALCVCAVENGDCTPTGAIDFGLAEVGSSVEKAVRFVSCGSEAVELTEAEIERRPGHPFETGPEFDALSTFSTGVLPPGQFSEATLRYAPTTPGQHEGGLRYRTASGADAWVALTGQSATCQLDAVPNRINFGTVAGGVASDRTVVLTNLGGRACTVTALSGLSGVFSIFDAPALPFTVDPGRTQNIGVRFSPPTGPIQDYMATLQIASDAVGAGAREVELVAIGGGEPQCTVEVAPSGFGFGIRDGVLNFGTVNVGYTTTLPIRIRNIGNAPCTLNSFRAREGIFGGTGELTASTATPPPISIFPGLEAEILTSFAPTADGRLLTFLTHSVDFELSGPAINQGSWSIGVLAQSTLPAIDVLPRELNFGTVTWERPQAPDNRSSCGSEDRVVTVYNSGSGPLTLTNIEIASTSDPVFLIREVRQGGQAVAAPYNNLQVNGGDNVEITLRFFPSRATPASHNGLLVIDNDVTNPMGNGAPLTVPLVGQGTTSSLQIDRFEQFSDNKVDILWVVDDSGSMTEEQSLLSNNFQSFISFADGLGVDYQVGVITTEVQDANVSGLLWSCSGFNNIIRSTDANRVQAFECAAQVTNPPNGNARPNPGGSDNQEAGLQAARAALDVPNVTGANAGFIRSDARVAVIMVSDEDDQSNGSVNLYVDFFRNLKGFRNAQLVSVSAIAGDVPNGCATADAGARYDAAVRALGGQFESICNQSWNQLLRNIGLGVFALRSSWTLSRVPDTSTVRVTVNGTFVPRNATTGWTYDAGSNSIEFQGSAVPTAGSTIEVSYSARCLP